MARRRSINLDKVPELVARHKAGATLRELVEWLKTEGCTAAIETVRGELARAGQVFEQRPDVVIPEAEPETAADRIKLLRHEVSQERAEARKHRALDWKRYHSAMRLTMDVAKFEAKPAPGPAPGPAAEGLAKPAPEVVSAPMFGLKQHGSA